MQSRITDKLNEWIGEALSESEVARITVPPDIATMLKKSSFRQFAIDSLISVKKSVTGSMADSIVHLYQLLDLKKDSVKRFKSIEWYFRARGIYELYMMQQHDYQQAIMKYTNSNNEYVRMEAQTAIIGFAGFKGLVFLDNLTHSLNEWQQIKLLEQLETLNVEEMEGLPGWLRSTNDYVVQFGLKLADIFQQLQVHNQVVACLSHRKIRIRYQAIKTLGRIANEDTNSLLRQMYYAEEVANRMEILRQLSVIGTTDDVPFLTDQLHENDDRLKLEAGRAIVNLIGDDGLMIIQEQAGDSKRMESIFNQIKFEMAL